MKNSKRFPACVWAVTALGMLFFIAAWGSVSVAQAQGEPEGQQASVRDGQKSDGVAQSPPRDLTDYVGSYEGRIISLTDSTLYYHREGMPMPVALKKIEKDHFEIVIPPGAQVRTETGGPIPTFRFDRGASGEIESLSMVNPDKSVLASYKKES